MTGVQGDYINYMIICTAKCSSEQPFSILIEDSATADGKAKGIKGTVSKGGGASGVQPGEREGR